MKTRTVTLIATVLALALAAAAQSQGSFTIQVVPSISITTTSLPNGEVGLAYTGQVAVTGGVAPYSFSLLTASPFGVCGVGPFGPLPAGLALNATTGAITGTPTAAGTFPVCVQVRDNLGGIAAKRYGGLPPTAAVGLGFFDYLVK